MHHCLKVHVHPLRGRKQIWSESRPLGALRTVVTKGTAHTWSADFVAFLAFGSHLTQHTSRNTLFVNVTDASLKKIRLCHRQSLCHLPAASMLWGNLRCSQRIASHTHPMRDNLPSQIYIDVHKRTVNIILDVLYIINDLWIFYIDLSRTLMRTLMQTLMSTQTQTLVQTCKWNSFIELGLGLGYGLSCTLMQKLLHEIPNM